jgi:Concanavalin A-like lectin/glucanases superfamily/Secretion system C-terminal sorting domain
MNISKIFIVLFLMASVVCFGQSLKLTTSGACVDAGDLDISGNQITLEATILMTDLNSVNIISKHVWEGDDNYLFRPRSFEITTGTQFYYLTVSYPYELNKWYHVAATYDGASMKYYVNGCQVAQMSATGTLFQNDYKTTIGYSIARNSEPFYGNLDEIRIWNVARTQAQIQANALDLPNPTTQTGLKLYYKFSNNYTNLQGNATFNGIAVGTPTFNAAEMTTLPPLRRHTEGLVAHYLFAGNAQDASGNNNHGTVNGATLTTDRFGNANKAYSFNGINNFITVAHSASLRIDTQLTLSAWVKTATSYNGAIFNKGRPGVNWDYGLATYGSYSSYRATDNDLIISEYRNRNDKYDEWHMITLAVNELNNTVSFYFDGKKMTGTIVAVDGISIRSLITPTEFPIQIGMGLNNLNEYFNGKIDDIRIYNRAFNECEVHDLYELERSSNPPLPDLLAWYPFTGNARDSSGNHFHGTIHGATFTTDRFGVPNKALYFNGFNNYVSVPDNDTLDIGTRDYSMVAWIKTNTPNFGRIISKGSSNCVTGYMMRLGGSHSDRIHLENAFNGTCSVNYFGNRTIQDNEWHCIAGVVKRDSSAKIFMDGQLDREIRLNTSTLNLSNNLNLFIGASHNANIPEWFKGSIDEIRIYGKALYASEIEALCPSLKESTLIQEAWSERMLLFPNPAQTTLTIQLENQKIFLKRIQIINALSIPVLEKTNDLYSTIDISNLPIGLYFLHLETQDGKQGIRKFVKN